MKTYTRILATCIVTLSLAFGLTACNPKEKIDELLTPTSVEEAIAAREAQFAPTVSSPTIIQDGYPTVGLRTGETTAPFCIVTWLFLLPLLKFDEAEKPDHSNWNADNKKHLNR